MPQQSSNILQTLLGVMQLKQSQQAEADRAAEAQKSSEQQGWQLISSVARRTTDPMMLTKLAAQGERWGLGRASDILDVIGQIQPDEDTLRSYGAREGIKAATGVPGSSLNSTPQSQRLFGGAAARVLTGQDQGALAGSSYMSNVFDSTPDLPTNRRSAVGQVMRERTLTGQGLTENTSDIATSGIPDKVFQDAFSMAHGFQPTWTQKSASDLGWAGLRSEDAARQGQTAIGLIDANGRAAGHAAQGQLEPKNLPDLFSTQRQLLNDLQTNIAALSPADKLARLRSLRGLGQTIRSAGGYAPDFDENQALQAMNSPDLWNRFQSYIMSKPAQHP